MAADPRRRRMTGWYDPAVIGRSAIMRIADYKHWLRFVIGADGALTVHAIAIDRVGRRGAPPSAPRLVDRFSVRPRR